MKTIHKYQRSEPKTKRGFAQFRLCDGKKVTFQESGLSWFWKKVSCKKCLAKKP
jgi:hypothetical protein